MNQTNDLKSLLEVGTALSTLQDLPELLDFILSKSIEITNCEGASIALVKKEKTNTLKNGKQIFHNTLHFLYSMNVSSGKSVLKFSLPINESSIAGYSVSTGSILNIPDAYKIPLQSPFFFNSSFDKKNNYRTQSILCIPIKTADGKVLGALQLVNKYKKSPGQHRLAFEDRDESFMQNFAAQAAIAIHNTQLRDSITRLFRSFVNASVTAIESRDPATSGHSARVAILTIGLAKVVSESQHPRFKEIFYTDQQLQEIRYATLLHDFGKIGVREEVLVKAKKLFPYQLDIIRERLRRIESQLENVVWRRFFQSLEVIEKEDPKWFEQQKDRVALSVKNFKSQIEKILKAVETANQPHVFEGQVSMQELTGWCHEIENQIGEPVLTENEIQALSITKGSLSLDERREIESHVTHSYRFLKQIAWTEELENVPFYAYGHHEKLDGTGYPLGLEDEEMEMPTRIMAITDIYDSLTASDRPYKKAISTERTLDILLEEANDGKLDIDLVNLFIEQKVFLLTQKRPVAVEFEATAELKKSA